MIGIDITSTQNQYKNRGIGIVAKNIIERFIAKSSDETILIGFEGDTSIDNVLDARIIRIGEVMDITPLTKIIYKRRLQKAVDGLTINSFFSPFIHSGVPYSSRYKTYIYVHDLIQKENRKYSEKSFFHNYIKMKQYARDWNDMSLADLAFTNSQISKSIIEKFYGLKNIEVAYPGVDHNIYNSDYEKDDRYIISKYDVKDRYALYYGGNEANKNIYYMIDIFADYSDKYSDNISSLVILGSGMEKYRDYVGKKYSSIMERIKFPGFRDEREKLYLIINSTLYINLTSNEGFGLSVLENLSCGVPCMISDIPVYREVFGDSASYVPLDNIGDAVDILNSLFNNSSLRAAFSEKGVLKSNEYTWDNTFDMIYRKIK